MNSGTDGGKMEYVEGRKKTGGERKEVRGGRNGEVREAKEK